ncbi:hypothetical protein AURDEDRAFT_188476 [Auricularia subglabra TFB-10046 SS5]|nr:hypothetical protein AURDEDRAFT_188476 [Auricularia subglabra TFB-10046 SS5]
MHMSLLDLADETLLQVARLVPERPFVKNLARTCKRVQRVCDAILWKRYLLVVRAVEQSRRPYPHRPPFQQACTPEEWAVMWEGRIAHLRSKAAVVRELTIEDNASAHDFDLKRGGWPDSEPFAQDLMDAVMPAVQACSAITSLRLVCNNTGLEAHWPSQLWSLIQERFTILHTLSLEANFVDTPFPSGQPKKVDCLQLSWCEGLINGLLAHDMLLANTIKFEFPRTNRATPPSDNIFIPPPNLARHLKTLDVSLLHMHVPGPVFDVSPIPHAEIRIRIWFDIDLKLHYPPAWRKIKPHIASLVTDDMKTYEVRKNHDIYIDRPSLVKYPDYPAAHQDHVRPVALDRFEQEEMDLYYEGRTAYNLWGPGSIGPDAWQPYIPAVPM